jgi:GNAT superfamily N-acetyltransferase
MALEPVLPRPDRTATLNSVWKILVLFCFGIGACVTRAPASVTLESSAVGFHFLEGEPVNVALVVSGPNKRGRVTWELRDIDTQYAQSGTIDLPAVKKDASARIPIPIQLPERGLYRLSIRGRAGRPLELTQNVALTFPPGEASASSPWGVFYVPPIWFESEKPDSATRAAESLRRLGAQWTRLNFYAHSLEPVTWVKKDSAIEISADLRRWKRYVRELRGRGIRIMGTIAQIPRVFSSKPDAQQEHGDGGPTYNKVPPADYALWEQLVENLAREFRGEIDLWEIWNEPDNQGVYWQGTFEEFAELVKRTAAAVRRGNADARVGGCGFTCSDGGLWVAEILLRQGIGPSLDFWTTHYTDGEPQYLERWSALLRQHGLNIPHWNTEERTHVPLNNWSHGLLGSAKFLHVAIGYEDQAPLVEKDYSLRPAGLAFATASHLIGDARHIERVELTDGVAHLLQRGDGAVGFVDWSSKRGTVWQRKVRSVEVVLPAGEARLTVTRLNGKSQTLTASSTGLVQVESDEEGVFLHGVSGMQIQSQAKKD